MYAEAIALASLATAVMAIPQAPPAYGGASSSSSYPAPAYTSSAVVAPTYGSASYSASASASASASYPAAPSASAYPSCWAECFAQNKISSESALCGNTAVDACIQQDCSSAEDQAYWAWYESYCPATTAPATSTAPVYSTSSVPAPIPTSSAPACWTQCFAENDVTSEAELCGDDAVSQCIYETCDSGADQAYWAWYEGYCTGPATVTTVVTLTSPCASTSGTVVVTTGWESTAWTPAGAPTGGAAPYPSGGAGGWGSTASAAAAATGTGAAWPAQSSGWPVVPATGSASTVAKSGFALLAGFLGLVALL